MSETLLYTVVDGIKCYNPEVADCYADYPHEGFDLTHALEEGSFWCQSRNRLLKDIIRRYSRPVGKTTFLEVGCATGGFIGNLLSDDDIIITGSEIYLKGLQYAKRSLPDVEFIQFDVTKNSLNRTFDMIGAFDVIEHIEEDDAALSTIYNMLSEGGYFIVTVPQYRFLWSRIDEIVKHKRRYSRKQLLSGLERHGFTVRFCSSFLFVLFPLMLVSRLFDKLRGNGGNGGSTQNEFQKRVQFPLWLNRIFDGCMRMDEVLIKCGISLPYGGSLLAVAQKTSLED